MPENTSGEDQFDQAAMESWTVDKTVGDFDTLPEYTPPPVGIYHFKLVRKDPNTLVDARFNTSGKPKYQAKFHFEIFNSPDPQWNGEIVHQYYNISLNELSNLRKVVEALIGRPLLPTDKMGWKDGQVTNADGTISNVVGIGGRMMTATLTHRKAESGRIYPKLEGFIPYKIAPPPAPAAVAPEEMDTSGIEMDKVPF
jgi:hypothetical protein